LQLSERYVLSRSDHFRDYRPSISISE